MLIRKIAGVLTVLMLFSQISYAQDAKIQYNIAKRRVAISGQTESANSGVSVLMSGDSGNYEFADMQISDNAGAYCFGFNVSKDSSDIHKLTLNQSGKKIVKNLNTGYTVMEHSEKGRLCYYEDFSGSALDWILADGVILYDGKLKTSMGKPSYLSPEAQILDGSYTVCFRFKTEDSIADKCTLRITLNYNPHDVTVSEYYEIRILSNQVQLGGDAGNIPYVITDGHEYEFKAEVLQQDNRNLFDLYIRKYGEADWQYLGRRDMPLMTGGGIGFSTTYLTAYIDDVYVYDTEQTAVMFYEKSVCMQRGDVKQLSLYNPGGSKINFYSDNNAVAEVDSYGKVTAIGNGTAIITAELEEGETAACAVKVATLLSDLYFSHTNITMCVGDTESVALTGKPSEYSDRAFLWRSSDESVVTVLGEAPGSRSLKAVGEGRALITAYSSESNLTAQLYVTVNESYKPETEGALFSVNDSGYEIPPYLFGVGNPQLGYYPSRNEWYRQQDTDLFGDIGFMSVRGPDGNLANYYRYQTGDLATQSLQDGYFGYALEDAYITGNTLGIPTVFCVNMVSQTIEEIVEQIGVMRTQTTEPVMVELGNELYAETHRTDEGFFPSAQEYIDKCRQVYTRAKALYPDVKIGVVSVTQMLYDQVYLQNPQIAEWNDILAENTDCFDAIIPHNYITVQKADWYNSREMMDFFAASNEFFYNSYITDAEKFPGKEIWVTEYGTLLACVFSQKDSSEQDRLQFAKSMGVALNNAEMLLNMIKSRKVQVANYHCGIDSQGFGLAQNLNDDELSKLPNYHVFKAIGDALGAYEYMYDINAESVNTHTYETYPGFTYAQKTVEVEHVGAWGFGGADGAKCVFLFNRTANNTRVHIRDKKLKQIWSYGGSDAMEGYLEPTDGNMYALPGEIPLPDISEGEFLDEIVLSPYSVTVVELMDSVDDYSFEIPYYNGNTYIENVDYPLAFSEDFSGDLSKWNFPDSGSWTISNGAMQYNSYFGCAAEIADSNYDDFMLIFDCKRYFNDVKSGDNGSVYITARYEDGKNGQEYAWFILGPDSVMYKDSRAGISKRLGYFDFDADVLYRFKLIMAGSHAELWGKRVDDAVYTLIGQVEDVSFRSGRIGFSQGGNCNMIDNVMVYAYSPFTAGLSVEENSLLLTLSNEVNPDTVNMNSISVSDDKGICSADYLVEGNRIRIIMPLVCGKDYVITINDSLRDKNSRSIQNGLARFCYSAPVSAAASYDGSNFVAEFEAADGFELRTNSDFVFRFYQGELWYVPAGAIEYYIGKIPMEPGINQGYRITHHEGKVSVYIRPAGFEDYIRIIDVMGIVNSGGQLTFDAADTVANLTVYEYKLPDIYFSISEGVLMVMSNVSTKRDVILINALYNDEGESLSLKKADLMKYQLEPHGMIYINTDMDADSEADIRKLMLWNSMDNPVPLSGAHIIR